MRQQGLGIRPLPSVLKHRITDIQKTKETQAQETAPDTSNLKRDFRKQKPKPVRSPYTPTNTPPFQFLYLKKTFRGGGKR